MKNEHELKILTFLKNMHIFSLFTYSNEAGNGDQDFKKE